MRPHGSWSRKYTSLIGHPVGLASCPSHAYWPRKELGTSADSAWMVRGRKVVVRVLSWRPFALALTASPIGGAGAVSAAMASASASAGTAVEPNCIRTTFEHLRGVNWGEPVEVCP